MCGSSRVDKESIGPADQPTTTNPDLIVTPARATSSAANGLASHVTKPKEGDTGKGEVNYAATWDEFPNGRFGDVNSPAFGSQDLWGGFGRIVSATGSDRHRSNCKSLIVDTDAERPASKYAFRHHHIVPKLSIWRNHIVSILPCAAFQ